MPVSALPGKNKTDEILHFCQTEYYYLSKATHKNTRCPHFCHYCWQFIQPSIFLLPTIKVFDVSANNKTTGIATFSPFVDSSVHNARLQTNPDFTSHFLNSYIPKRHMVDMHTAARQSNRVTD